MVDSISGNESHPIQESPLRNLGLDKVATDASKLNQQAAFNALSSVSDDASISDQALNKFAQEKEALQFSRLAQRLPESFNAEKVALFKGMVESGNVQEYLNSLDFGQVADSMLQSPTGAALK